MEKIKTWLSIIALLTAVFQMLFANDQRAKEHFDTTARLFELSQEVKAQNIVIETALNTKIE